MSVKWCCKTIMIKLGGTEISTAKVDRLGFHMVNVNH